MSSKSDHRVGTAGPDESPDESEDSVVRAFPGSRMKTDSSEGEQVLEKQPQTLREPETETETADESDSGEQPAPPRRKGVRAFILPVVLLTALGAGGWYGYNYWTDGRFLVNTDDAYLQADMSDVSPKVQGYVDEIRVHENQHVKAGDVLFRLDGGDYRIAIDSARAKLQTQQRTLERIKAQIEAAGAAVRQAEASRKARAAVAHNAELTHDRVTRLYATKVTSQAQVDDAQAALDQANADLAGADAQIASAKANVKVLEAQYAEAESVTATLQLALDQAELNFSYTELKAPFDGVIGNIAVHQGDLVSPGQKLAAVVPLGALYVEANFKETQLAGIAPGETARISVDALPDRKIEGTVTSLAPASGSVFSLLPPENATGNFTKVVQRVPVRIDLPADVLATGKLRAGMSVVIDIDTRTAPGNGNS